MTQHKDLPSNDVCAELLRKLFTSALKESINEQLQKKIMSELEDYTTGLYCIHAFVQHIKTLCPPDKLASLNSILIKYYEPILQNMRAATEQSIVPNVHSHALINPLANTVCFNENKSSLPGFKLEIRDADKLPADWRSSQESNHLRVYWTLGFHKLCEKFNRDDKKVFWQVKNPGCLEEIITKLSKVLKTSADETPAVTLPENVFEMKISENKKCADLLFQLLVKKVEACDKEAKFSVENIQDFHFLPNDFLAFYRSVFSTAIDSTHKEIINKAMRYLIVRCMVFAEIIIVANTEQMNGQYPLKEYRDDDTSYINIPLFPAIKIKRSGNFRWLENCRASIEKIMEDFVDNNQISILPHPGGNAVIYRVTNVKQLNSLIKHLETQLARPSSSADEKAVTSTQSDSSLIASSVFSRADTTPATTIASTQSTQKETGPSATLTS